MTFGVAARDRIKRDLGARADQVVLLRGRLDGDCILWPLYRDKKFAADAKEIPENFQRTAKGRRTVV